MNIYIDVDGVIADYVRSYLVIHGYDGGVQMQEWGDLWETTKTTKADMDALNQKEGFLESIQPYPWADALVSMCRDWAKKMDGKLVLCTAIPYIGRYNWCKSNYPGIPLIQTKTKEYLAGAGILIDDADHYCSRFQDEGGTAIVFPQPYNAMRHHATDVISRIAYVDEKLENFYQDIYSPPPAEGPSLESVLRSTAKVAKPDISRLPPAAIIHGARACSSGNPKHGGMYNWRKPGGEIELMWYCSKIMRHILAVVDGEWEDKDSGNGATHLGAAIANCGIILDAKDYKTLIDDRPSIRSESGDVN